MMNTQQSPTEYSAEQQSSEQTLVFACGTDQLVGILHSPTSANSETGVVIVVGGPQYRVGSHRQFLELARGLAATGYPTLRFDYRGMGDSTGTHPGFESIDTDIDAAVNELLKQQPQLKRIVLWGLCDGASAAVFYAPKEPRIKGLILVNPWARTEQGEAKAYVKSYYGQRLFSGDFWGKLFSGQVKLGESFKSLFKILGRAIQPNGQSSEAEDQLSLPERLYKNLAEYSGETLFILSGQDLTADEFVDVSQSNADWQQLMQSTLIQTARLEDADHTFSRQVHMQQAIELSVAHIKQIASATETEETKDKEHQSQ